MEIPDVLRNLTVDDEPKLAFIATLLHDEPSGMIVKKTAFFDDHLLKEVLMAYRAKAGGASAFTEVQASKATFAKKIEYLGGLTLGEEAGRLRDLAVTKLGPMRNIRNLAAHKASLSSSEVEELYRDAGNRHLLADFPANFKAECSAVQAALQNLVTHPEFACST